MNEINREINSKYKYQKVSCANGHIIANVANGVDLDNYIAGQILYLPIDADLSEYMCITDEQHNEIVAQLPQEEEEIEVDDEITE